MPPGMGAPPTGPLPPEVVAAMLAGAPSSKEAAMVHAAALERLEGGFPPGLHHRMMYPLSRAPPRFPGETAW